MDIIIDTTVLMIQFITDTDPRCTQFICLAIHANELLFLTPKVQYRPLLIVHLIKRFPLGVKYVSFLTSLMFNVPCIQKSAKTTII